MDWLTNTPFLTKERGFLLQVKKSKGFYADHISIIGHAKRH
jgi:hypothetical protein